MCIPVESHNSFCHLSQCFIISGFPINQNQFTAAVTEECTSVDADFDPSLDDDLEADLYQACQSCSLATGGSQQSKRQGLMIINQCSRECIATNNTFTALYTMHTCMHMQVEVPQVEVPQ
jgi:hypothetical protein